LYFIIINLNQMKMKTKNLSKGRDQVHEIDHNQIGECANGDASTPSLQKVEKISISVQEKIETFEKNFIQSFSNMQVDDGSQKVVIYANSSRFLFGYRNTSVVDELLVIEGYCKVNQLTPVKLYIDYPSHRNRGKVGWRKMISNLSKQDKPEWYTENMDLIILDYTCLDIYNRRALEMVFQAEQSGLKVKTIAPMAKLADLNAYDELKEMIDGFSKSRDKKYAMLSGRYRQLRLRNIRNIKINRQNGLSGSSLEKAIVYLRLDSANTTQNKYSTLKQVKAAKDFCSVNQLGVAKVFVENLETIGSEDTIWDKLIWSISNPGRHIVWAKNVETLVIPDYDTLHTDYCKLMEILAQLSYLGIQVKTMERHWSLIDEKDKDDLREYLTMKRIKGRHALEI
jgi:hypothetical protein